MKEFADDNFQFDEWVENTVGKGEIARYEQFLLFLQCFQKAFFPGASKGVIMWKWIKCNTTIRSCVTFQFENIWRKKTMNVLANGW